MVKIVKSGDGQECCGLAGEYIECKVKMVKIFKTGDGPECCGLDVEDG